MATNADTKISLLANAQTLTGAEYVPITQNQNGTLVTVKTTTAQLLANLGASSATFYSVLLQNPDRTGVASASTAFNAANAASTQVWVPSGSYLIGTNVTLTSLFAFENGAVLTIPNGVTLTLNGPFEAGVYQIFNCTGTGAVVINHQYRSDGYPEWWGAITNSGSADCSGAINACIVACRNTRYQAADYYINASILQQTTGRAQIGQGSYYPGSVGYASRIVQRNLAADIVVLGPSTNPGGGPNSFMPGMKIQDLCLAFNAAPVTTSAVVGVRNQWTLDTELTNVRVNEALIGFSYKNAVVTRTTNCYAFRSTVGTGGSDYFYGYYLDGSVPLSAGGGGNASLYFSNNGSGIGGYALLTSYGMNVQSTCSDLFVEAQESASMAIGFVLNGNGASGLDFSSVDVQIRNSTSDSYLLAHMLITNMPNDSCLQIIGGYGAPASTASANSPGYSISACLGTITISDSQIIAGESSTSRGMNVSNSSGVFTKNNKYIECGTNAIVLSNVTNSSFEDITKNLTVTAGAAYQLNGTCTRNYFGCKLSGKASAFTFGYQIVGASTANSEYNGTGIDPACLTVANQKLSNNGTNITTLGAFGTGNQATGVLV